MNDKIYKIFISSTYKDLKEHRRKVIEAILKMEYLPVGMEMFNASSNIQWKVITDSIDDCDYYVLILGKRYGSVMKKGIDKGMSYTEREFRYAMEHGVPYMGFLISDDADVKASNIESDPDNLKRLNEFKKFVEDNGTVNYWKNADELAGQVRSSLEFEIKKHPRNGWVRFSAGKALVQMAEGNASGEDRDYDYGELEDDYDPDELLKEGINIDDENILRDFLCGQYEKDDNGWYFNKVPDGVHVRRMLFKDIKIEEGTFKDDKLQEGISYRWILKFWKNVECGCEDTDALAPTIEELTEETEHADICWALYFQYGQDLTHMHMLEDEIENEGSMDKYFIVDKKVYDGGKKIKLFNMRTLESFLEEYDPDELKYLKTGEREWKFDEEVEDIDFSGLMTNEQAKKNEKRSLKSSYDDVVALIRDSDKEIAANEIAEKCAISLKAVRSITNRFLNEGKIERVGSRRIGGFHWKE